VGNGGRRPALVGHSSYHLRHDRQCRVPRVLAEQAQPGCRGSAAFRGTRAGL